MTEAYIKIVFSPRSPSGTYVIYDQFHFGNKDHFHETVRGWDSALSRYKFHKLFNPQCVMGLCTVEYYNHLLGTYSFPPRRVSGDTIYSNTFTGGGI